MFWYGCTCKVWLGLGTCNWAVGVGLVIVRDEVEWYSCVHV